MTGLKLTNQDAFEFCLLRSMKYRIEYLRMNIGRQPIDAKEL